MPTDTPSAPPPPPPGYPTAPPPGYAPAPMAGGWSPNAPPYRGPLLPPWLTFGAILILVGALLFFAGYLVDLIGTASYFNSTAANAAANYAGSMETADALIGVGVLIAALGWIFHQMSVHRRSGH